MNPVPGLLIVAWLACAGLFAYAAVRLCDVLRDWIERQRRRRLLEGHLAASGDRGSVTDVGLAALALLGFAVFCVLAYLGYWWIAKDTRNRQSDINRHGFEQQTTYRDEIIRKIGDVRTIDVQIAADPTNRALIAQRAAVVTDVCRLATHLSGDVDPGTAQFLSVNC